MLSNSRVQLEIPTSWCIACNFKEQRKRLWMTLAELVLGYDIVKKLETLRISSQHQKYMRYIVEERRKSLGLLNRQSSISLDL